MGSNKAFLFRHGVGRPYFEKHVAWNSHVVLSGVVQPCCEASREKHVIAFVLARRPFFRKIRVNHLKSIFGLRLAKFV